MDAARSSLTTRDLCSPPGMAVRKARKPKAQERKRTTAARKERPHPVFPGVRGDARGQHGKEAFAGRDRQSVEPAARAARLCGSSATPWKATVPEPDRELP